MPVPLLAADDILGRADGNDVEPSTKRALEAVEPIDGAISLEGGQVHRFVDQGDCAKMGGLA